MKIFANYLCVLFLFLGLSICAFSQESMSNILTIKKFIVSANQINCDSYINKNIDKRYALAKKKPIAKEKNSRSIYYSSEGSINTFRKAMDCYGKYFTERVADFEINRNSGAASLWGRIAPALGGAGDHDVMITKESTFKLVYDDPNKKIVNIIGIDYDNGGETRNLTYTLIKINGQWLIADEVGYYPSIEKRQLIDNKYVEKIYITWNATASSELPNHPAKYIQDKKLGTAWSEGVNGNGQGEWIKFTSPEDECFIEMEIVNGYAKSKALYQANNRVKKLRIEFDEGQVIERELKDNDLGYQKIEFGDMIVSRWVRLTILDTYPGTKYDDTCISEVRFY